MAFPRLLTFSTGLATEFQTRFGNRLSMNFQGILCLPRARPPESRRVLRTFSSEWVNYDWDGKSYWNLKSEAWFRCMRFALDLDAKPVAGNLVLEAGIGIGGVSDYVCRTENCEQIGLDLGYAVDSAYRHFGKNLFLHLVQASVFAPPFATGTFDFVYSFGVIHHTYSTETAFRNLAQLPQARRQTLYLGLQSLRRATQWPATHADENGKRGSSDSLGGCRKKCNGRIGPARAGLHGCPVAPLRSERRLSHRLRVPRSVACGRAIALRPLRSSPHGRRVGGWFQSAGFVDLTYTGRREKPDFVPVSVTACTGVSGIRGAG